MHDDKFSFRADIKDTSARLAEEQRLAREILAIFEQLPPPVRMCIAEMVYSEIEAETASADSRLT